MKGNVSALPISTVAKQKVQRSLFYLPHEWEQLMRSVDNIGTRKTGSRQKDHKEKAEGNDVPGKQGKP